MNIIYFIVELKQADDLSINVKVVSVAFNNFLTFQKFCI